MKITKYEQTPTPKRESDKPIWGEPAPAYLTGGLLSTIESQGKTVTYDPNPEGLDLLLKAFQKLTRKRDKFIANETKEA